MVIGFVAAVDYLRIFKKLICRPVSLRDGFFICIKNSALNKAASDFPHAPTSFQVYR